LKKLIPVILLFLITACTQENIIHIQLPLTYGLQVDNQIQSEGEQLGIITDVRLFENGLSILVSARLDSDVEIPINSEFAVEHGVIIGSKMIEVTYSNETDFYQTSDTVDGFYIDPLKTLIDSMMGNTMDLLQESTILSDSTDVLEYLDSIFDDQSTIVIPTH
jgi:hypothetical protein